MRINIIAFALGVCLLQLQAALPSVRVWCALLAFGLLALFLFGRRPSLIARLAAGAACLAIGFGWAALLADGRLGEQLPEEWEGRDVQVVGIVASLPQAFERGERVEFEIEAVETPNARLPHRVMLSWYHGWQDDEWFERQSLRPGERWRLTLRLKRPHGNANPHGFDYEAWLFEQGVRASGYVRPRTAMQRLDAFVPRPAYVVERLRERIRTNFLATLPGEPYAGILTALVIGDQRVIPNAQWVVFSRTGTTHLMSISGLHVTMVAALVGWLVGFAWRRSERAMRRLPAQQAAIVGAWLGALGYTLLAGYAVPAQRTLYMLSVVAVALWSGRNTDVVRTLLLALLAVLLLDPWAVVTAGFWLSFGAVAVLLYAGSARLGEGAGWRAALARWGATQWAVTVGTLPLLLFLFQQFSLVSPLANAVAIPLVSFVVTPLALLAAILPLPWLLQLDHLLLAWLMAGLEWLAAWPIWQQPAPPLWATLTALAGLAWLLLPRGWPARWVGAGLLLPALLWQAPRPAPGEAWATVLDVGQGLAVVVQTAEHALLYDTGPMFSAEADAGQRVVVPYLRAVGLDRLDALIVTHRDKDHSGGVASVRAALPVARLLSSVAELPGERCAAGQQWEWDGVRFAVLHPAAEDYAGAAKKSNHMSCVLRVETAGGSFLLTSDIEAADEAALLARSPEALRADVLLAPHHGSRTSSTPEFIAAVGAQDVVFPVGYRNRFGHPRPDIVERYAGSRLWRTDRDGALTVRLGGEGEGNIAAQRDEVRRYWHGQ